MRRQDHDLSTRLPYANKKIREIYYSMAKSTENVIDTMQNLKVKINLKSYKNNSNFYNEMK